MANPGQSSPPGQRSNANEGMGGGMMPRDPNRHADVNDPMLNADEAQTLEHGGYGGEQEYMDSSPVAEQPRSTAQAVDSGEYVNQTDMTDETGDSSQSEAAQQLKRMGQGQPSDMGHGSL